MINTSGIVCPGCQPNDFPVPHICGTGVTMYPSPIVPPTPAPPCEHCWCIADDRSYLQLGAQFYSGIEPHDVCCSCGSRRLKAEEPRP